MIIQLEQHNKLHDSLTLAARSSSPHLLRETVIILGIEQEILSNGRTLGCEPEGLARCPTESSIPLQRYVIRENVFLEERAILSIRIRSLLHAAMAAQLELHRCETHLSNIETHQRLSGDQAKKHAIRRTHTVRRKHSNYPAGNRHQAP